MSEFHFLRPWWLLGLVPCLLLVVRLYSAHDPLRPWRHSISADLLPYLLIHGQRRNQATPLSMLAACWSITVIGLSGPTWQREPAPFGEDTAVLVVVLKVTPSMLAEDIQPTRLTRSVEKIHDLLKLRPGAKTALVAYSGSAHQVLPLTTDATIITSFAGELLPKVMPTEGDEATAALNLADQLVRDSGARGWILWIADAVDAGQLSPLKKRTASASVPITVLAMSGDGPERRSLRNAAVEMHVPVVPLSPDDTDVHQLAASTHFSTASEDAGERWRDSGYWLVPVLCVLCLGWFRQGWVIGDAS